MTQRVMDIMVYEQAESPGFHVVAKSFLASHQRVTLMRKNGQGMTWFKDKPFKHMQLLMFQRHGEKK